jgi:hypothetical protein
LVNPRSASCNPSVLILSLDLPFTGDVGVGPAAMKDVLEEFAHCGG